MLSAVLAATAKHWDTSHAVPYPRPGWLVCPVCRDPNPRLRWWRFHQRAKSRTTPYRCDVSWKCIACACVWMHGVVLPADAWEHRPAPWRDGQTIAWRHGRRYLKEAP